MMSRLYLGVHSPADIVVGGIIGCIVLAIWMKTDDLFDMALSYGTNSMYKHHIFYEDITNKTKGLFPIWSSIQDRIRI
jgi:membrane-associated phospholipid phosphatase